MSEQDKQQWTLDMIDQWRKRLDLIESFVLELFAGERGDGDSDYAGQLVQAELEKLDNSGSYDEQGNPRLQYRWKLANGNGRCVLFNLSVTAMDNISLQ